MSGLRTMGTIAPTIFLGVAAFLLNAVLSRIIPTQREEIAMLKAFGYTNLQVGMHYLNFALVIVVVGTVLGAIAGMWLGHGLTNMYARFYRFPVSLYQVHGSIVLLGFLVSLAAAAGATAKTTAAPAPAAPAKPSISGSDVNTIEEKMKNYPRILWHSRDNTYRFYVGTVVFAEYNPFKNTFMIMTDNADHKNLVCKYDPDGGWKVEGSVQGASCRGLLKEMDGYLSQTS